MSRLAVLDADQAARKLVKRRWRDLAACSRALHKRRSRAHLHDFRVALRRLRAIMTVCDEQVGLVARKSTRRALKELAAVSGTLRDSEVLREQLDLVFASDHAQNAALAHDCSVLLDVAYRRAEKNFARLFHAHRPMFKSKIRLRAEREAPEAHLRQILALHVMQLIEEIRELTQSRFLEAERLHALRIETKKVRYTLEEMDDETDQDLLQDLRRAQDRLGAVHDLDHALEVVRRWEPQLVRDGAAPGAPDFPRLMERVTEARAARLADWQREFPSNGEDLYARVHARVQALAATNALELALI
jgi:CHAD domain-containing protein